MLLNVLKGKIHRARVVQAELDYVGSITVDMALAEAAGILEYEKVQVVDIDNGNRFETYVIAGEPGSGITLASVCPTDKLDLNWQRLIFTHLLEKPHLGVLTGSPITDIKITLLAGRAHEKHT